MTTDTSELRGLEPVAWLVTAYSGEYTEMVFWTKFDADEYANDFDTHQFDEPHETRAAYEVHPQEIADELDALRAEVRDYKLAAEAEAQHADEKTATITRLTAENAKLRELVESVPIACDIENPTADTACVNFWVRSRPGEWFDKRNSILNPEVSGE